eukprot:397187-Amphidinium_carterae.1
MVRNTVLNNRKSYHHTRQQNLKRWVGLVLKVKLKTTTSEKQIVCHFLVDKPCRTHVCLLTRGLWQKSVQGEFNLGWEIIGAICFETEYLLTQHTTWHMPRPFGSQFDITIPSINLREELSLSYVRILCTAISRGHFGWNLSTSTRNKSHIALTDRMVKKWHPCVHLVADCVCVWSMLLYAGHLPVQWYKALHVAHIHCEKTVRGKTEEVTVDVDNSNGWCPVYTCFDEDSESYGSTVVTGRCGTPDNYTVQTSFTANRTRIDPDSSQFDTAKVDFYNLVFLATGLCLLFVFLLVVLLLDRDNCTYAPKVDDWITYALPGYLGFAWLTNFAHAGMLWRFNAMGSDSSTGSAQISAWALAFDSLILKGPDTFAREFGIVFVPSFLLFEDELPSHQLE